MRTSRYHVASDGTRIWYGTAGDGPIMVLCDGFACDGFIWPYIIDHFVEGYTIVRWHYRGHGRSDTPEDLERMTIEEVCRDLIGVLDELGARDVILVGHSMGVQIILQTYAYAPERIRALIPVCGTYKRPLDTFGDSDVLARALPFISQAADYAPETLQFLWEKIVSSPLAFAASFLTELDVTRVRGEDFRPYLEHTAMMDLQVYLAMLGYLAEHSAEDILPTIDVPTLVIASELDSFTPLHRSQTMASLIPDSQLLVLPGGSHAGPIELPDTVIGAMEKFLS
ncbi:MAG: alpha/beta hydrolase [Myxococcota bacterium]